MGGHLTSSTNDAILVQEHVVKSTVAQTDEICRGIFSALPQSAAINVQVKWCGLRRLLD